LDLRVVIFNVLCFIDESQDLRVIY
jgi:hypothetical protein